MWQEQEDTHNNTWSVQGHELFIHSWILMNIHSISVWQEQEDTHNNTWSVQGHELFIHSFMNINESFIHNPSLHGGHESFINHTNELFMIHGMVGEFKGHCWQWSIQGGEFLHLGILFFQCCRLSISHMTWLQMVEVSLHYFGLGLGGTSWKFWPAR